MASTLVAEGLLRWNCEESGKPAPALFHPDTDSLPPTAEGGTSPPQCPLIFVPTSYFATAKVRFSYNQRPTKALFSLTSLDGLDRFSMDPPEAGPVSLPPDLLSPNMHHNYRNLGCGKMTFQFLVLAQRASKHRPFAGCARSGAGVPGFRAHGFDSPRMRARSENPRPFAQHQFCRFVSSLTSTGFPGLMRLRASKISPGRSAGDITRNIPECRSNG